MPIEDVNLGTDPTGEGGDTLREAFAKVNANFGLLQEPGAVTSQFTTDVDGNDRLLYDLVMQGFRDRPYDLSVDSLGLNVGGTVTLIDGLNVVVHPEVTTALTIALPTPAAGEAPFGVVSYLLGAGGSVALAATPAYQWEKVNLTDDGPTLPTAEGSVAHLHYRWDVISESYLVTVTRSDAEYTAPPPATALDIVTDSFQMTDYSAANRDVHTLAYAFDPITQDGTVYLVAGFITDGLSSKEITPPSGFTQLVGTPSGQYGSRQWWGYRKVTQGEIDATTYNIEFNYLGESGQVMAFVVQGADGTDPALTTCTDVSNSSNRTGAGPCTLALGTETGALLLAAYSTDDGNDNGAITPAGDSGWTTLAYYHPDLDAMPNFMVQVKVDAGPGDVSTPSYTVALGPDEQALTAFALKAAVEA